MEVGSYMEHFGDAKTEEEIQEIIRRTYGMALLYGVQMSLPVVPEKVATMPFTLYPSIIPKQVLQKAFAQQKHFQRLIGDISRDHEFLKTCLEKILPVDEFTRNLWKIYETVRAEKDKEYVNPFANREHPDKTAPIGAVRFGYTMFAKEMFRYSMALSGIPYDDEKLPNNCPVAGLAEGMVEAWKVYNNPKAAVLFVVGIPEPNTPDQRWLEREMFKLDKSVRVLYRTFEQLQRTIELGPNKELLVGRQEIAIVYFRYGYSPKHYPTEQEYDLRLQMERSIAIKCPSVSLHLAGCKKVQQELCKQEVLKRYVSDESTQKLLQSTFMGQISLDKMNENTEFVQRAVSNPDNFVLKPQREGGGNNIFGNDVKVFLESTSYDDGEQSSWILMERIRALEHRNRLIRSGIGPELREVNSELGIYGAYLRNGDTELCNTESGFLLRTKPVTANEGGLFHGQSCLDSPYLV